MTDYRRWYIPGASWFFNGNLAQRYDSHMLVEQLNYLRESFAYVKRRHPIRIEAVAMIPEQLHGIWTAHEGDADFSTHWNLIKGHFSRPLRQDATRSASPQVR